MYWQKSENCHADSVFPSIPRTQALCSSPLLYWCIPGHQHLRFAALLQSLLRISLACHCMAPKEPKKCQMRFFCLKKQNRLLLQERTKRLWNPLQNSTCLSSDRNVRLDKVLISQTYWKTIAWFSSYCLCAPRRKSVFTPSSPTSVCVQRHRAFEDGQGTRAMNPG